jgi:hypothetical protein
MTFEERKALLENRIILLEGRGEKNVKSQGVLKKLRRQLRNMNK